MVDAIFDAFGTGGRALSFAEVRLLSEATDGVAMTCAEYQQVAQVVGFDAAAGMDRACLRRVYLEMKLGDVEADYHAVLGVFGTVHDDIATEGSEQNPMLAGIKPQAADVESALERLGEVEWSATGEKITPEARLALRDWGNMLIESARSGPAGALGTSIKKAATEIDAHFSEVPTSWCARPLLHA